MGHSNLASFVVFLPSPEESEGGFLGFVAASSPFDLKPSFMDFEANFHMTMEEGRKTVSFYVSSKVPTKKQESIFRELNDYLFSDSKPKYTADKQT